VWLSLVERSVWDREVGGSNPLAPILKSITYRCTLTSLVTLGTEFTCSLHSFPFYTKSPIFFSISLENRLTKFSFMGIDLSSLFLVSVTSILLESKLILDHLDFPSFLTLEQGLEVARKLSTAIVKILDRISR
jgi:hypothetical protein